MSSIGKCRVYKNGKYILGPAETATISNCVPVLIGFRFVAMTVLFLEVAMRMNWEPWLVSVWFLYTFILLYHAYVVFKGFTTDPGILKRDPAPEVQEGQQPIPMLKYNTPTESFNIKWCRTCHIYRSPLVSHCSLCDNCVYKFDHHCIWLNMCIGARNMKWFIKILITTCLSCYLDIIVLSFITWDTIANYFPLSYNYSRSLLYLIPLIPFAIYTIYVAQDWINSRFKQLAYKGYVALGGFVLEILFIFLLYINNFGHLLANIIMYIGEIPMIIWITKFTMNTFIVYSQNKTIKQHIKEQETETSPLLPIHVTSKKNDNFMTIDTVTIRDHKHTSLSQIIHMIRNLLDEPDIPPFTDYSDQLPVENRPFKYLEPGTFELITK